MTITYIAGASPTRTVAADAAAAYSPSALEHIPRGMPLFISRDQAYYWSFAWQKDIRESMAALEAGDYEEFDSDDPNDVVRWLLSEEG
jgi:hypothetical protein